MDQEIFNCKLCNKKMELIIQEIQDTGYAYYCYTCGSVLVTEIRSIVKDAVVCGHVEEEVEWYIPRSKQK